MKPISYKELINKAFSNLATEIEDGGIGHILTYEEIEDIIFDSFRFDEKQQCFWLMDSKELVTYAYELTLIDEKQLEDFYMWKLFKVK